MKETLYNKVLGVSTFDKIVEKFHDTTIDTNKSYDFFVNWDKVRDHVNLYKIELNILNSLIGSTNFDDDLRKLLRKYPEVLPVIPLLIAERSVILKIIRDFSDRNSDIIEYNFNKRKLSSKEIEHLVQFFNNTGLKFYYQKLASRSILDYATGVEVGMDTHARKNRSGKAMEMVLEPIMQQINSKLRRPFTIIKQRQFTYLEKNMGIEISSSIRNRTADFILYRNRRAMVNIEVNFYSGTGSKPQEIVDSYITRQRELIENKMKFIWITDGEGWKGQKNQIRKGFEKIDYLLNLHFVRRGLLQEILCQI